MATHSIILAWRNPWTEEPGGLCSAESDTTEATQRSMVQNAYVKALALNKMVSIYILFNFYFSLIFIKIQLNYKVVYVLASTIQCSESIACVYIYTFFFRLFSLSMSLQSIKQSSLCYTLCSYRHCLVRICMFSTSVSLFLFCK